VRYHIIPAVVTSLLLAAPMAWAAPANPPTPTSVEVRNDRATNMVIYAQKDSRDIRLGTVAAGQSAVLDIPGWLVLRRTEMRFFAEPAPDRALAVGTSDIIVKPNERVGLIVSPNRIGQGSDAPLMQNPR
jgi:hypothetical protein